MKRNLFFVLFLSILAAPVMAAIAFQPANPLPGQDVSFTIQQSSPLAFNVISWDFGDGTIRAVNNKTIQHAYNQSGSYTVKVRFKYLLGSDVLTATQIVSVSERRQIVAAPDRGQPGQSVSFQALNFFSGQLSWDFGDGHNARTGHSASHVYGAPGTYAVRVREQSGDNPVTISKTVVIADNRAISFSPAAPAPGQKVNFKAQNHVADCVLWNFGDGGGNIRGTQAISHSYSRPGTYAVSARDYCGDAQPVNVTVTVIENRRISFLPQNPGSGQDVSFTAQHFASDCVVWNFADGRGDVRGTRAMTRRFDRAGRFQVSARDHCGDAQPVTVAVTVTECRRIEFQPSPARAGETVNFSARNFTSPCIVWQFSDGGPPLSGQAAQAHTFINPGSYRVAAIDDCGRGGAPRAELTVVVAPGVQPSLFISRVHLHFEDGRTRKQVPVEERDLQAVADLQYQGTGSLMLEWLVDGQPLAGQALVLTAAGQSTIKSGLTPPLPTRALGRHRVTLRLLAPRQALQVPTIEYTVFPEAPLSLGPRVMSVLPPVIHQDREYLLKLKGENFDSQTRFDPGAGIAPRGQPLIISSQEAELRVFTSREISEGPRLIKARNAQGGSTGPGKLIVERLSETLSDEISLPCPDVTQIQKMLIQGLRPDGYYSSSGEQNRSDPHVLTNESILSWTLVGEPAAITFYEVEFYQKQGSTMKRLVTRRIPGQQTFLKSDFALIEELRKARFPGMHVPVARPSPCDSEYQNTFDADIWWTVKGYLVVDCPWGPHAEENSPQSEPILVPRSGNRVHRIRNLDLSQVDLQEESWPKEVLVTRTEGQDEFELLNLPNMWTGIQCPGAGKNPGGMSSLVNIDRGKSISVNIKTGEVTEIVDSNNYPMERWEFAATIDTRYSPLAVSGDIGWKPAQGMNPACVDSIVFDNIFIDWGDGTVQRLAGTPQCQSMVDDTNHAKGQQGCNLLKDRFTLDKAFHRYLRPGDYTIRVYQLPAGLLANAPPSCGDPEYFILTHLGQMTQNSAQFLHAVPGQAATTGSASPKSGLQALVQGGAMDMDAFRVGMVPAMDHGVLFFCQEVNITNYQDLCASGPLNLVEMRMTGFPGPAGTPGGGTVTRKGNLTLTKQKSGIEVVAPPPGDSLLQGPGIPTASTCDELFTATAEISFFGKGSLSVLWAVDGLEIARETYHGLSSPQRQGISSREAQSDCSQALHGVLTVESPALPVKSLGRKELRIIARVIASPSDQNFSLMLGQAVLSHGNPASVMPWVDQYMQNLPKGIDSQGVSQLHVVPGLTWPELNDYRGNHSLQKSVLKLARNAPPLVLVTDTSYWVREARPGSICRLVFPTQLGDFIITNIEGRLQKTAQGYSGEGILMLPFTSGSDSNKIYGIPIPIQNWLIDETSGKVTRGGIDLSTGKALAQTPAVAALVRRLNGRVQNGQTEKLMLTLDMEFKNKELRLPGDAQGQEKPPAWTKAEALNSEGDWKAGASLPAILLSWSSFKLSSPQITFDFHKQEHFPAGGPCSTADPSWVGVDLGDVTIKPYTFDLIGPQALAVSSSGWVVTDQGICGHMTSGPYAMKFKKGAISFEHIVFDAADGDFSAVYKGMVIHVPWLEADLKGDATLNNITGKYGLDFHSVVAPTVEKNYGQFTLTASDLKFTTEQNIGWVVRSQTRFNLKSENKTVAEFTVPQFFYGFDGYPYFSAGEKQFSLDLGQSSKLGDTRLMLQQVLLTAHGSGGKALSIAVPCEAYLSENPVIPAAATQLDYAVIIGDPLYAGTGPAVKPFILNVEFPLGSPVITARMSPEYHPGTGGGSGASPGAGGPSSADADGFGSDHAGTRYYGHVDMGMFGAPPVDAQLLLGYQGGKSYFLIRGDIPLGPSGIPMSPLPFSLFRLSGGMGYNFPVNSFYDMSIENAQPDMSGETLFMAGMRIGSSDRFTFMLDGITTVKTSGEAGMKFDAWLLSRDHSGNGQLQGILQYGGGAFSGKMWGGIHLLNGMVGFNLGGSEQNAALDVHLGQGDWHFYAGRRDGQRIAAMLLGKPTAEGYLMLGNQVGLAVGGRQNWSLTGGDAAYVKGFMDVGLQISPQPRVSGDFHAGLSAGICVPNVACVGGGVSAHVRVSALPLDMKATASLDLPWPAGSITFTVNL